MRHFTQLAAGVDVVPLALELNRYPELWDQHSIRRTFEGTPHGEMVDVWVRMRAQDELTGTASYKEPYRSVFYPAWTALPALRPIVRAMKHQVDAVELGPILITRLPPGAKIAPHDDRGSWCAEWFNTKGYLTIAANDRCVTRCGHETVIMRPGDIWVMDNLVEHAVANEGDSDRVTLIVSMRCE